MIFCFSSYYNIYVKQLECSHFVFHLQIFPPKTTGCRSECELSGSYASLECPSPPGPPVCLPESRRDPQVCYQNLIL